MYKIVFTKTSEKQLKKIPKKVQLTILKKIEALADNPSPEGVKALKGKLASYCRVRCGDYRIIYSIENNRFVVLIVKIGHR